MDSFAPEQKSGGGEGRYSLSLCNDLFLCFSIWARSRNRSYRNLPRIGAYPFRVLMRSALKHEKKGTYSILGPDVVVNLLGLGLGMLNPEPFWGPMPSRVS